MNKSYSKKELHRVIAYYNLTNFILNIENIQNLSLKLSNMDYTDIAVLKNKLNENIKALRKSDLENSVYNKVNQVLTLINLELNRRDFVMKLEGSMEE